MPNALSPPRLPASASKTSRAAPRIANNMPPISVDGPVHGLDSFGASPRRGKVVAIRGPRGGRWHRILGQARNAGDDPGGEREAAFAAGRRPRHRRRRDILDGAGSTGPLRGARSTRRAAKPAGYRRVDADA